MTGLPARLTPPEMTGDEVLSALIGAWDLVLWTTFHSDGSVDHPIGRNGIGQIMYSADHRMSCHLMPGDRAPLPQASVYDLPDDALGQTLRLYSGYFGDFTIDAAAGVITHHVTGAWYPNWIGMDQPRHYAFEGDRLFLEAEIGGALVRIEWRRASAAAGL